MSWFIASILSAVLSSFCDIFIFACGFVRSIFEILFSIWPLPKGLLIYEVVFIYLMNNIFFSGYLVWGLLAYKILDYYLIIIPHFIICLLDKISERKRARIE